MAKGLLELVFDEIMDSVFDANWTGRYGEKLTERELKFVRLLGRKGKILRNVYVPKENGETAEIDVLYITQKGIFVIESKNYSGWIFGDEDYQYWTVMLPNKTKNRFYNPVKQNQTHCKWLAQTLDDGTPLFSIIVFSQRCELKKVTITNPDIFVIKRDWLYAVIRKVWETSSDCLSEEQVNSIYVKLEKLIHVDLQTKTEHVENIKRKYDKKKEAFPIQNKSCICPRCGGRLVLRTAKKGVNAGKTFYGCSNYPKCHYITNEE